LSHSQRPFVVDSGRLVALPFNHNGGPFSISKRQAAQVFRHIRVNYPQPDAVVALQATIPGAFNPVRPFRSYGAITNRETTARSRYHGLLTAFKYLGGRAGTASVS